MAVDKLTKQLFAKLQSEYEAGTIDLAELQDLLSRAKQRRTMALTDRMRKLIDDGAEAELTAALDSIKLNAPEEE